MRPVTSKTAASCDVTERLLTTQLKCWRPGTQKHNMSRTRTRSINLLVSHGPDVNTRKTTFQTGFVKRMFVVYYEAPGINALTTAKANISYKIWSTICQKNNGRFYPSFVKKQ